MVCDLPVAVLMVEADGESDDQSDWAGNRNHRYETDAPPSTSLVDICVVPQILKFLPFRTPDVPQRVGRGRLSAISWRLSQEPAMERAVVCFWGRSGRQWDVTGIFFDD